MKACFILHFPLSFKLLCQWGSGLPLHDLDLQGAHFKRFLHFYPSTWDEFFGTVRSRSFTGPGRSRSLGQGRLRVQVVRSRSRSLGQGRLFCLNILREQGQGRSWAQVDSDRWNKTIKLLKQYWKFGSTGFVFECMNSWVFNLGPNDLDLSSLSENAQPKIGPA